MTIADLRPFAEDLSLDREGFGLLTRPSRVTDFYDDEQCQVYRAPSSAAFVVAYVEQAMRQSFDRRALQTTGPADRAADHEHIDLIPAQRLGMDALRQLMAVDAERHRVIADDLNHPAIGFPERRALDKHARFEQPVDERVRERGEIEPVKRTNRLPVTQLQQQSDKFDGRR